MHKMPSPSALPGDNPKQQKKKLDDRRDKKKVKFTTGGDQVKSGKQVNVVQKESPYSSNSENETSETNLPEETSVSSDGSEWVKYFDLLSSSSEEYDTDDNVNNDE